MTRHEPIEHWITETLTGSGLSCERREAIAEEWRTHLEQLMERHQGLGSSEGEAVAAALREFGSPAELRRRLLKTQRFADRRAAWSEVRSAVWMFTLAPGLLIALLVILLDGASLVDGCAAGLAFVAMMSVPMALCMYYAARVRTDVLRKRPRAELVFAWRLAHWSRVSLAAFVGALFVAVVLIVAVSPLFLRMEVGQVGLEIASSHRAGFVQSLTDSCLGLPGGFLGGLVVMVAPALMATLVERSRSFNDRSVGRA